MQRNGISCLWEVDRKRIIVMLAGAVIYGLLLWLNDTVQLPNILVISLKPAIIVPIFCGLLWGPMVGFVVGALGSFVGDILITNQSFGLYWDVGNGLLGLVAGLSVLMIAEFRTWKDYLLAELWTLVAVYVSLDYLAVRQVTYEALPPANAWSAVFTPAFLSNSVSAMILIPILIWIYGKAAGRRASR